MEDRREAAQVGRQELSAACGAGPGGCCRQLNLITASADMDKHSDASQTSENRQPVCRPSS
jgi:hypothetical protein